MRGPGPRMTAQGRRAQHGGPSSATDGWEDFLLTRVAVCVLCPFVTQATPPTPSDLSDRFAAIVEGLYQATARAVRGPMMAPLILLICARLRRITARFASLAARYAAGTLRPLRTPATEPRATGPHLPPPRDPLPRGYAWLIPLVPGAASYGSQLQYLLSQPEMAAMIAAVPRMATLLRPLCRCRAAVWMDNSPRRAHFCRLE